MFQMATSPETPKERIKRGQKELQEILKKYNLTLTTEWDFPMFRELPIEVQLALKVIEKNGGVLQMRLIDKSKK